MFSITRFPVALCAVAAYVLPFPGAASTTPEQIDSLTAKWLSLERQSRTLESDWTLRKPSMQQRITLLRQEKKQLHSLLEQTEGQQDEVANKRSELLQQQNLLEQQQALVGTQIARLQVQVDRLYRQLPPPLQIDEQGSQIEPDNASQQLQQLIARLNRVAEFDQRISINEQLLPTPEGKSVMVKQFYLGAGNAWFTSADGSYRGWGQASPTGWQWHFDGQMDAQQLLKAIAIFEKRQAADFVQLPLNLMTTEPAQTASSQGVE